MHSGEPAAGEPIAPDITVGSAFTYPDLESLEAAMSSHHGYGRWGTANHEQLEEAVAALEATPDGRPPKGLALASGMSAIAVGILTEASQGDRVVVARDIYGTTLTFLKQDLSRLGIETRVVDVQDIDAVEREIDERTRMVLCEMCTNPLIRVPDLEKLAEVAHRKGALLMVDNTVPTPILCQPFRFGADIVVHSATKNLSGHADVIGGVLLGRAAWMEGARSLTRSFGPTLGPFDAWLTLRGLRTLAVRMERHTANALALATFLASHPGVRSVHYACLDESPYRARAGRYLPRGAGALFSFELNEGLPAVREMIKRLRLVRLLPSLGHVATTLSHPASTSHRGLTPEERAQAGISQGLLRCSVGLESIDDLREDFAQAIAG